MDPITLAVTTSAVVTLASKVVDGAASEAGKSLWTKIQGLLGFQQTPTATELAATGGCKAEGRQGARKQRSEGIAVSFRHDGRTTRRQYRRREGCRYRATECSWRFQHRYVTF